MDNWTQSLSAGPLLAIAAGAILLILVMIIRFRVHALLTLVLVSLLTAIVAGLPLEAIVDQVLIKNFGGTLGSVAILVGFGAMLGRLVETSGGAQSLADALVRLFGEKRAAFALGVASLIFGFPIFFDAGLVVMLPIVFATARRMNEPVLPYGLASIGAFSVMHVFLPPHPGPIAAGEYYGANIGHVLLLGLPIAVITWYCSGYLLGQFLGRHFHVPVPDFLSGGKRDTDTPREPAAASTVPSSSAASRTTSLPLSSRTMALRSCARLSASGSPSVMLSVIIALLMVPSAFTEEPRTMMVRMSNSPMVSSTSSSRTVSRG